MILNLGYQWPLSRTTDINGVTYLAGGNDLERMQRNAAVDFDIALFDPQLYLRDIAYEGSEAICTRLATYEWFGLPLADSFDSSEETRTDWKTRVSEIAKEQWDTKSKPEQVGPLAEAAVLLQQQLGCTYTIAPTPLITERENEGDDLAQWLDASIEAVSKIDNPNPLLATVAISETCLNDAAFEDGGFLDTVVDQVSARPEIVGVYYMVAQTHQLHPFLLPSDVYKCYLHLTERFSSIGYDILIPNFCDIFGFACAGLGATHLISGGSQSLRRLCMAPSSGGRGALPRLYSHQAAAEFMTETDLDRVRDSRALRQIEDLTAQSRPLFRKLRSGGSAAELTKWAESSNNVSESRRHFINRLCAEWSALSPMDLVARQGWVSEWLDDAAANMAAVRTRLATATRGQVAPAEDWLDAFELYL